MPATSRTRTRSGDTISFDGMFAGSPFSKTYDARWEQCSDVIGDYGGNHVLNIERRENTGCRFVHPVGSLQIQEPGFDKLNAGFNGARAFGQPGLNTYVNRVLATSGPISPQVMLPLFVYEMKDIPDMIRHAGDLLHKIRRPSRLSPDKEAAAATLAYQFGWAPLMQDLGKLLLFSKSMRQTQQRLKGAHSKKGIGRKVKLGKNTGATGGSVILWSTHGLTLSTQYTKKQEDETWAKVYWVVRDPTKYGYDPSFMDVFNVNYGLNRGMIPIYLWKALPWSWMADWFTDISNIMLANYNTIYYRPYRLSIMRTTIVTSSLKERERINGSPQNYLTSGTSTWTFKERYANNNPSTSFTLRLPFIDSFKASVLGSLAILKARGR